VRVWGRDTGRGRVGRGEGERENGVQRGTGQRVRGGRAELAGVREGAGGPVGYAWEYPEQRGVPAVPGWAEVHGVPWGHGKADMQEPGILGAPEMVGVPGKCEELGGLREPEVLRVPGEPEVQCLGTHREERRAPLARERRRAAPPGLWVGVMLGCADLGSGQRWGGYMGEP